MSDRKTCAAVSALPLAAQKAAHVALAFFVSKGVLFVSSTVDGKSVAVRVDKNPAMETSLCQEAMCALQSTALLGQMRAGTTMLVRFTPVRGAEIGPEEFTLIGFDAAYRKAVEMQKAK